MGNTRDELQIVADTFGVDRETARRACGKYRTPADEIQRMHKMMADKVPQKPAYEMPLGVVAPDWLLRKTAKQSDLTVVVGRMADRQSRPGVAAS